MKKINLFLLNMSYEDNISGVNRYLDILIKGLLKHKNINLCYINFISGNNYLFPNKNNLKKEYLYYEIPLPISIKEILIEPYWMKKYSKQVFKYIAPILDKENRNILHIHTINLIDFALYIKSKVPCVIITHLHCIPWKNYYNTDRKCFNRLYKEIEIEKRKESQVNGVISLQCEMRAYINSDHIICVTKCAHKFIMNLLPEINKSKISVIYNGIYENIQSSKVDKDTKKFSFLYVGTLTESKGLKFILDAMKILKNKELSPKLIVAGKYGKKQLEQIKSQYADLDIDLKGLLTYSELQKEYIKCHAGVIASLQEQCSYAAIEMMMHALPIIVTDIDGLHEMFNDNINALKIPVSFTITRGLEVNVPLMAEAMEKLMKDDILRNKISEKSRDNFEKNFSAPNMINQTILIYEKFI